MDFISEAISEFVGGHDDRPSDPPYVQPPWVAHWDGEAGSWIFINEATGERTFQKPVIEEAGESILHRTTPATEHLHTLHTPTWPRKYPTAR